MPTEVTVVFGTNKEYLFRVADGELTGPADEAHRWLDAEWTALGIQPIRPTGKVLVLDKVLQVARAVGERRFAEDGAWARTYARHVARLLERSVRVDVAGNQVG